MCSVGLFPKQMGKTLVGKLLTYVCSGGRGRPPLKKALPAPKMASEPLSGEIHGGAVLLLLSKEVQKVLWTCLRTEFGNPALFWPGLLCHLQSEPVVADICIQTDAKRFSNAFIPCLGFWLMRPVVLNCEPLWCHVRHLHFLGHVL